MHDQETYICKLVMNTGNMQLQVTVTGTMNLVIVLFVGTYGLKLITLSLDIYMMHNALGVFT